MAKSVYNVCETNVGPTKDASFRSCLCIMLVFISICIILIAFAWPWNTKEFNSKGGTAFEQNGTNKSSISSTTSSSINNITYDMFNSDEDLNLIETSTKNVNFSNENKFQRLRVNEEFTTTLPLTTKLSILDTSTVVENKEINSRNITENSIIFEPISTTLSSLDKTNIPIKFIATQETVESTTNMILTSFSEDSTTLKEQKLDIDDTTIRQEKESTSYKNELLTTTLSNTEEQNLEKTLKSNYLISIDDLEEISTTENTDLTTKNNQDHDDVVTKNELLVENNFEESTTTEYMDNFTEVETEKIKNFINSVEVTNENEEKTTTEFYETQSLIANTDDTTMDSILTENLIENEDDLSEATTVESLLTQNLMKNEDDLSEATTVESLLTQNLMKNEDDLSEATTVESLLTQNLMKNEDDLSKATTVESLLTQNLMKNEDDLSEATTVESLLTQNLMKNEDDLSEATTVESLLTQNLIKNEETTTVKIVKKVEPITEASKETSYEQLIMETDEVVPEEKSKSTVPPKKHHKEEDSNKVEEDKCGAECKRVGARILSRMNHSADPCEQFYEYACGGDYIDNTPEDNWNRIADGLEKIHVDSPDVYKTFRSFYDSCVAFHSTFDYDKRVADVKNILLSIGKPQKETSNSLEQTEDETETKLAVSKDGKDNQGNETASAALTDLLTKLLQLGIAPLFDVSMDVDKQSQHFVFQLNMGNGLSSLQDENSIYTSQKKCFRLSKRHFDYSITHFNYINLNEMYEVYTNCRNNYTDYIEIIEKVFEVFSIFTEEDEEENVLENLEVLLKFKQLFSPVSLRKNFITKKFVFKKVSELIYQYPLIDWLTLFKNLVGRDVDRESLVQVYNENFFLTMFGRKNLLTHGQLYNVLLAMSAYELYTNIIVPISSTDPEKFCLYQSSNLLKEVASSFYLNSLNDKHVENLKSNVSNLFIQIKSKLTAMMLTSEWIAESRASLTKKLQNIILDTQSDIWKNVTLIKERMNDVINIKFESYVDFVIAILKRNQKIMFNMWNTKASEPQNIWWHFSSSFNTHPVSIYSLNRIVIPSAMLMQIQNDLPSYITLAKVGYHLAKSIGYQFDTTGINYKLGLTKKEKAAYDELQTCMATNLNNNTIEYDRKNLKFQFTNESLSLTFNERFVEDMAINLLSKMMSEVSNDYPFSWIYRPEIAESYSQNKLFFVTIGQEHCKKPHLEDFFLRLFESEHLPSSLLLDTSLSHSDLFSNTFSCKNGARLNIEFKCAAFPDMPEAEYEEEA